MKLEARISKEKLAKAGLFLAKALLLIVTIRLLFTHDIGAWVIAIFLIASLILVQRKSRFGYSSAKVVVGVLAILPLAGVLNPFTYQDFSGSPAKYAVLVVLAIFSECVFLLMFYGLQEHQRLCSTPNESKRVEQ